MQKWEYMKLSVAWHYSSSTWRFVYANTHYQGEDLISIMNELGREGWEHVSVVPFHITIARPSVKDDWIETSTNRYDMFFKRSIE